MEFCEFDRSYLERLRAREPLAEQHFVAYFGELVTIKLRSRLLERHIVEDIRQETFARVLAAVQKEGGIRQPERLGAYVNSVCNNVLLEFYRSPSRTDPLDDKAEEIPDRVLDLDGILDAQQCAGHVQQILRQLPEKDRRLLRAIFFEEKDKDQICAEFGVNRDYLRVLLHRAKQGFKSEFRRSEALSPRRVTAKAPQ